MGDGRNAREPLESRDMTRHAAEHESDAPPAMTVSRNERDVCLAPGAA